MTQAIKFVSTMALFYVLVSAPAIGQETPEAIATIARRTKGNLKGAACTLSDSQTQKSIVAFARIADFVTKEPRCVNCHGAVNPYVDHIGDKDPENPDAPASTVKHGGGRERHEHNGGIDMDCMECHDNMAPKRDRTPSLWMLALSFLSFLNKDAPTLCKQFKLMKGNAKNFMEHLKDDSGGNNFSGTAFLGTRGLNYDRYLDKDYPATFVPPAPPSISHEAFMKLGQDWIDAMGGEFKGDEACG